VRQVQADELSGGSGDRDPRARFARTARPLLVALIAALLFGASIPASKRLLERLAPLELAGWLYLGAAAGTLPVVVRRRRERTAPVDARTLRRLAGAIVLGGIVGPVLVLLALRVSSGGSVGLLLNFEMVATALLGALLFQEHLGRAGAAGVAFAIGAGTLLSFAGGPPAWSSGLLVVGACIAWGFDNQLSAIIDGLSPWEIVFWKGLVAGGTNLLLARLQAPWTLATASVLAALLVGVFSYGASITLYVISSHALGATRAQSVFATAPFFGAALSFLLLGESLTGRHLAAGASFALGIALLLLDRHAHRHSHEALVHMHSHRHDDGHHDHRHPGQPDSLRHTHAHLHEKLTHSHAHLPDLHHRHRHDDPSARESADAS
jgi:drug/metabolite transporter (DMT)-like permease